jgi:hypothetical protein
MPCNFPEHHQSSGGGGGLAVLVLLVVIVAAAVAGPVVRVVTDVVEVAAVTAGALLVVAVVAVPLVWRARRKRARRARPAVLTARVERAGLDGRRAVAAIEPLRADVSALPREDVEPHVVISRAPRPRCTRRDGRRS